MFWWSTQQDSLTTIFQDSNKTHRESLRFIEETKNAEDGGWSNLGRKRIKIIPYTRILQNFPKSVSYWNH